MIRMPNPAARRATSWPMRPRPASPSTLSRTSSPRNFFFSHLPCFIAASAGGQMPGERKHEPHGQLRDADAVRAGGIHDHDASRACRGDVHIVHAGSGAGDGAQTRRCIDQSGRDFRGAADHERIGVAEIGGEDVWRAAGLRVNLPPVGTQELEGGRREIVGDNYLHGRRDYTCALCASSGDANRVTLAQRWCKLLKRSGSSVTQPCWDRLFNRVSTETVGNCDRRSRDTALTAIR